MEVGLTACTTPNNMVSSLLVEKTVSGPAVVIIGAGMAGLSAASHLVNNGILNVRILEASNRLVSASMS